MHPSEIKIGQNEFTIYQLYDMIESGRIDIDDNIPKWDNKNMSLSIESLMLGLTMTPIYVDATNPEEWVVLDGKKRLIAIREFLSGRLKLINLEFFHEFERNKVDSLPRNFLRILQQTILTVYTINQGIPPEVRLSIIYRIVPDIKQGLSWKLKESLFTHETKKRIEWLTENIYFKNILKTNKSYNLELPLDFLKHYFQLKSSNEEAPSLKEKWEYQIVFVNKVLPNEGPNLDECWRLGLERTNEIFGEDSFKTTKGARSINKNTFPIFIIFFGHFITAVDFEMILNQKDRFIESWFEFIQKPEGKVIFKRDKPESKYEALFQFLKI